MWEGLTVNGFQFDDSMEYATAKKESDIINYIVQKMDIGDPQIALKVYYKLLERQDFKTVVGITFLKQLRDFCIQNGVAEDGEIKLISVLSDKDKKGKLSSFGDDRALETDTAIASDSEDMDTGFDKLDNKIKDEFSEAEKNLKRDIKNHISKEKKFRQVADYYRSKVKKCYFVIAGLGIIIAVLFILAISGGNTPFSDKEEEIQNKYASWAEELSQLDEALNQKAKELSEIESDLVSRMIEDQNKGED